MLIECKLIENERRHNNNDA